MAMAVEAQRQITALLFIAMVAGAEVRQIQQQGAHFGQATATGPQMETSTVERAAQEMELMIAEPNFPEQMMRAVKQMDAMLADPAILQQAKRVTEQMEALMTVPQVQERVKSFAERMKEMSSETDLQQQAELAAKDMESLQADPKVQEQVEHMKAIFADADFQKQGKRVVEQMEAMLADSSSQDRKAQEQEKLFDERSADGMVDTMLDKIVGRTITTPSIDRLDLDSAMVGKSSSPAIQPGRRLGVKSASRPLSIPAAPLRAPAANLVPFGGLASARSAVRVSARKGSVAKKSLAELRREQALEKGILDALVPDVLFELRPDLVVPDDVQEFAREASFLFVRLAAASVMVHHGQEVFVSSQLFTKSAIDKYFAFLPGPDIFWTYAAGSVQLLAPFFLSLGVFSRAAAASLAGTMLGAFYYSVKATGTEGFPLSKFANKVPIFHNYGFEAPALYLSIFLIIAVSGPGKFSVAQALGWNEDKSLLGKLKQ